jgi:hypothetical protein
MSARPCPLRPVCRSVMTAPWHGQPQTPLGHPIRSDKAWWPEARTATRIKSERGVVRRCILTLGAKEQAGDGKEGEKSAV